MVRQQRRVTYKAIPIEYFHNNSLFFKNFLWFHDSIFILVFDLNNDINNNQEFFFLE